MTPIVRFLRGEGGDAAGRTHATVLALDDAALERTHDFIQWLFPLTEPSGAVAGAPVLTAADIAAIRATAIAQVNLAAACRRMQAFYIAGSHWRVPADHNHLRITRIIRSLRLLVDDGAADGFRAAILDQVAITGAPISARSLAFWRGA